MKLTRIHTQIRVIDEDNARLLTFESFDGSNWFLYSADGEVNINFKADTIDRARGEARLRYYIWLASRALIE
jgi:hypothetical protein